MPGLLRDPALRHPALTVEIQCASSAVLERRLRGGNLDMAFVLAEEVAGTGDAVATDPVVWLQAPGADLMTRRPLPVALFDQACSWRNRAVEALAGRDFEVVFTSASVSGIRAGIRSGAAVGVLAASTAGPGLEILSGSSAPPPLPPAEIVLLRGRVRDEDASLFIGGARRQFRQSVSSG